MLLSRREQTRLERQLSRCVTGACEAGKVWIVGFRLPKGVTAGWVLPCSTLDAAEQWPASVGLRSTLGIQLVIYRRPECVTLQGNGHRQARRSREAR